LFCILVLASAGENDDAVMTCYKPKEVITVESFELNENPADENTHADFNTQKMTDKCYEQWTNTLEQGRGKSVCQLFASFLYII